MGSRERFRQLLTEAPAATQAIEHDLQWFTWSQLRDVADSLQALLERLGGDALRVGVILENRPEHVASLIGLIARDHCIVTLSGLQPPQRLSADLAASRVPVLVGSPEALAREGVLAAAGDALVLALSSSGVTVVHGGGRVATREEDRNHGVVIEMLTSGTTGPPKRVQLRESQFDTALGTSVPSPSQERLFRSGVTVVCTPLVHIGGFWGALAPLYAGRRIVIMPKFDLETWVRAIEKHRPRAAGLVPASLRAILDAGVPPERLDSLEVVTSGTTYCPPELIDAFIDRYQVRVLPTYGATEFAGAVATWSRDLHMKWWSRKAGSAGRAMPGVELKVTDDDGNEAASGEPGLLQIRTAQSPVGPNAWQRTSDLASVDSEGFLWIHGRADDAIIRGGFKVHPEQVKAALEQHPSVREATVAPLPDDRLGAVPVAAVELEASSGPVGSEDLRNHCRTILTPYEIPVYVAVLDALPRTPSSKVSRVETLALIEAQRKGAAV
ncbi:class I adenylate-forming enzyme family protein [Nocardioides panzhihuensis]|uniref:Acyl-coenzyme A synthetase/AMP-(Fatty) acid ligase n=1 Tax=Nocardioides panzhihuensis TaxID=860243 RepID=A0A7Z0DHD6_9ACTN|nr:fatty acid--CoA ligase family protein [Nocardioides panzhihuensis]NYI75548.1 acyl-coenzyme A synthetase/AMP-(fatty) acid ligase [Nocardioides panzhihuensis]